MYKCKSRDLEGAFQIQCGHFTDMEIEAQWVKRLSQNVWVFLWCSLPVFNIPITGIKETESLGLIHTRTHTYTYSHTNHTFPIDVQLKQAFPAVSIIICPRHIHNLIKMIWLRKKLTEWKPLSYLLKCILWALGDSYKIRYRGLGRGTNNSDCEETPQLARTWAETCQPPHHPDLSPGQQRLPEAVALLCSYPPLLTHSPKKERTFKT